MDFVIALFEFVLNIVVAIINVVLYPFGYRPKTAKGEDKDPSNSDWG